MSIPWVWSLVYTGYIHEPIPLKLGYKIRLALNKRIRTCEDEKRGGGGGWGGGGDRTMAAWCSRCVFHVHVFT